MRTYSRQTWEESNRAWIEGEFGAAWDEIRRIAADRGMMFPPTGTKWDQTDDPQPSQRAIVWREWDDNPSVLRSILRSSSSWSEVVRKILVERNGRNEMAELAERDGKWRREHVEISPQEATLRLGEILEGVHRKVVDSLPDSVSSGRPDVSIGD